MIALIQRVSSASVTVSGTTVGAIDRGILALIGIAATDTPESAARLVEKMLNYRIFPDDAGKMNLNISQIEGELLLVPQFTLLADTSKGTRPGFSTGAAPDQALQRYTSLVDLARARYPRVATGQFGAHMQVALVNDGPVTFWLEVP